MAEEYRPIPNYPNYEVSNLGNVRQKLKNKILKGSPDKAGYLRVSLCDDSIVKVTKIHRIVAEVFLENPDNKNQVDHINNDKNDNSVNNLRWCTSQENNRNKPKSVKNTSGIKGVCWDKYANKWKAGIKLDGISIHIGNFTNIEDAKQARIKKVNEVFGNFTHKSEQLI
jgi:hypothetical protein